MRVIRSLGPQLDRTSSETLQNTPWGTAAEGIGVDRKTPFYSFNTKVTFMFTRYSETFPFTTMTFCS